MPCSIAIDSSLKLLSVALHTAIITPLERTLPSFLTFRYMASTSKKGYGPPESGPFS